MAKKGLVVYASNTGNTELVAKRFEKVLKKYGWECDIFKISDDTNFSDLPFSYGNYDFVCVGSPTDHNCPVDAIKKVLFPLPPGPVPSPTSPHPEQPTPVKPVRLGLDAKKGVVFATYSGVFMGSREVEPVLSYMSVVMEMRLHIKCVGTFACPGKFTRHSGWYKDLDDRPNERDLIKAETFLEEVIEDTFINAQ